MDIKWKSIKFSTKKLYAIISPFSTIKQQITFKKSKNRFLAVFLHFSQKIVISRYKRHGYQMKELKILYKKGLGDHIAILNHWATNHVWKVKKSIFVGFLHYTQKIVISRYKRHGYQMKGLITPFCMTIFMLRCLFQK